MTSPFRVPLCLALSVCCFYEIVHCTASGPYSTRHGTPTCSLVCVESVCCFCPSEVLPEQHWADLYKETGDEELGGLGGESYWQISRWIRSQQPAVASSGGAVGAGAADGTSMSSGERRGIRGGGRVRERGSGGGPGERGGSWKGWQEGGGARIRGSREGRVGLGGPGGGQAGTR